MACNDEQSNRNKQYSVKPGTPFPSKRLKIIMNIPKISIHILDFHKEAIVLHEVARIKMMLL